MTFMAPLRTSGKSDGEDCSAFSPDSAPQLLMCGAALSAFLFCFGFFFLKAVHFANWILSRVALAFSEQPSSPTPSVCYLL